MKEFLEAYEAVGRGAAAFYKQKRGLIAVWGRESVQFLNGLITNDAAALEDGGQMTAAFPNAQGRLLALVRVRKSGERFLFETDEVTHEKVFQNLHRFTFAGDFFVQDMSGGYEYFEIFNSPADPPNPGNALIFDGTASTDYFVPIDASAAFENDLRASGAIELTDELYELLRIENGVPKYGVDMDESTVVLETGLDEAVSFNKGCYIGQEIIARIHFRGHVAKRLAGLILDTAELPPGSADGGPGNYELLSPDGKNAGRLTSIVLSPRIGRTIALGYVRYDYLAEGTILKLGETTSTVKELPFFPVDKKESITL
jgi:folate-binding protein YgfZ